MDYNGLIGLALVTIIYGTFVAPNLQKLAKVKEDIAGISFPNIPNLTTFPNLDENIKKQYTDSAAILKNKLIQYTSKYDDLISFLKYFYLALLVIILFQIILINTSGDYSLNMWLPVLLTAAIIAIVALNIRTFVIKPWVIKSVRWLAKNGIRHIHTANVCEMQLFVYDKFENFKYKRDIVPVSLYTKVDITGYRYLLSIESEDHTKLYYVAAGQISEYTPSNEIVYATGEVKYQVSIANAYLKPGKYTAKVLIFFNPYPMRHEASVQTVNFTVSEEGIPTSKPANINLNMQSNYEFYNKKGHLYGVRLKNQHDADYASTQILSSKIFKELFKSAKRPFILESTYGILDKHELDKHCTKKNYFVKNLRTKIKKKLQKTYYIRLVPKKYI